MATSICRTDIAALCKGSVFLGTGGGGDPYVSQLLAEQAIQDHGPVSLVPLSEVPDDAFVVAVGEVGAPTVGLEQLPVGSETILAIEKFETWVGRKITHLVSFEVGGANSVIPLIAASTKKLPLIDGDGMARALPEAQMTTFALEGVRPTPAVAIDHTGSALYFDTEDTIVYERQARHLAMAMGGMIFTVEHPMTGSEAKRAVIPGTISFARELGQFLLANSVNSMETLDSLKRLFEQSNYGLFRWLFSGKIIDINRKVVGGFDVGEAVLESIVGHMPAMTLSIKNEFLVARIGDEVVASVPDLIAMVEYETTQPINAERIHYGQRVTVIGIGCPAHYRTQQALEVVSPRAFGFDFEYCPIEMTSETTPDVKTI